MDNATRTIVVNWTVSAVALLAVGPLAGLAAAAVRSPEGAADTTALTSAAPVTGLVMAAVGLLLAGLLAVVAKPLAGVRMALASAGMVLLWSARQFGRPELIVRESATSGTMMKLAIEGALAGAGVLAIAWFVTRSKPDWASKSGHPDGSAKSDIKAIGLGAVVMVAVGGLVGMIVARSGLFGQDIAATIAAGIAGAAAARTVAHNTPTWALFLGGVVLAFAGPIVANVMAGGELRVVMYAGKMFPLAYLAPFDWAAGLLIGVPMGEAWASSVVERHEHGHADRSKVAAAGGGA
ncbi:MAG: hypothetical protein KDA20_07975 [Phycisphaerales bacterium]|nr:hypothetical protein [Phycisphaerales bacterium]